MNITEAGQCGSCFVISYRFSRNVLWPTSVDFRPVSSGVGEGGWFETISVRNLYERGGGGVREACELNFFFLEIYSVGYREIWSNYIFRNIVRNGKFVFFRDICRVHARWQANVILETWWVIGLLHLSGYNRIILLCPITRECFVLPVSS